MFGARTRELFTVCLLVLSTLPLHAGLRTINWDASPGATAYNLYYGTSSNNYTSVIEVGSATQTTVDLDDCTEWFFAVTASNAAGESGYSSEVTWLTPMSVDGFRLDDPSQTVIQGYQGAVTIKGARFEPGAVLELDNPDWSCDVNATQAQCDAALAERRAAVQLASVAVQDCNTVTAWASFFSNDPGRAPTAGQYDLTVTNADNSSAILIDAVEILQDPARLDTDKTEIWTDNRIDGLDIGGYQYALSVDLESCICCSDSTCPQFDHAMDLNGDGWIDGTDLSLVYTAPFGRCWDNNLKNWTVQACSSHPSTTGQ